MSMKNSNETIGNRTRDLPACSAVPLRPSTEVINAWNHSCTPRYALTISCSVKHKVACPLIQCLRICDTTHGHLLGTPPVAVYGAARILVYCHGLLLIQMLLLMLLLLMTTVLWGQFTTDVVFSFCTAAGTEKCSHTLGTE